MPTKICKITPEIVWFDFTSKKQLAKTFVRFQEFYEGPHHAGKIFTLADYKKYYKRKWGKWSYYKDWSGFNIPSHILGPFENGSFDPLREIELDFLDTIHKLNMPPVFYIIGTFGGGNHDTLKHEIAHALFYTNSAYRQNVLTFLGRTVLDPIFYALGKHEYNSCTWVDEAHAYIMTCADKLAEWNVDTNLYIHTKQDLLINYKAFTADHNMILVKFDAEV